MLRERCIELAEERDALAQDRDRVLTQLQAAQKLMPEAVPEATHQDLGHDLPATSLPDICDQTPSLFPPSSASADPVLTPPSTPKGSPRSSASPDPVLTPPSTRKGSPRSFPTRPRSLSAHEASKMSYYAAAKSACKRAGSQTSRVQAETRAKSVLFDDAVEAASLALEEAMEAMLRAPNPNPNRLNRSRL